MGISARLWLLAVLLLAACGASLGVSSWDNTTLECEQLDHGGGIIPLEPCRSGKGVLVEIRWVI